MSHLLRVVSRWWVTRREREHAVGGHLLRLPPGHQLDVLQRQWTALDYWLGEIARITFQKYPAAAAIDIGANIGDTAALISRHVRPAILCVEPSPRFLPWLRENARRIGEHVLICDAALGEEGEPITWQHRAPSTASAVAAPAGVQRCRALASVLLDYPQLQSIKLIKTDTDGFDFKILLGSVDVITEHRPVLFFEHDPSIGSDGPARSLQCIDMLARIGYRRFLVFDNFGNPLIAARDPVQIAELNGYLASNRRHGIAVYYFDICAFSDDDTDLAEALTTLIQAHLAR
ncbi:MAG TPA: FkbM family methyltransferase [Burkholderiales bacterium]|nr:FkbM family methyltransferase [Burkholderiales bacterium]